MTNELEDLVARTAFSSYITIAEERHYANLGINCGYLDLQT